MDRPTQLWPAHHAFEHSPEPLCWPTETGLSTRCQDIELGGLLAFVIDELVTPAEADATVQASERMGYRDEAPGIATPPGMRMNKSVHWMADKAMMQPLFERMAHLLPQTLAGAALLPALSHRINMYHYDDLDVFNLHTDGSWPGYSLSEDRMHMLEWDPSIRLGLTMLLYLNGPADGVQGGNTRLYKPDGSWVDVSPVKGSALFFRHGFGRDSVRHVGCQVSGPVSKYVARINVMFAG
ncbi:MAG: hypothetical protein EXR37_00845 [Limnohabitans sp.]|nr:hypothetical protein [Limnohabitans sp.]